MSAWMFGHDGMDRLVDGITFASLRGCTDAVALMLMDDTAEGMAARLFEMNACALRLRYPSDDTGYCEPPEGYEYQRSNVGEMQMLKTLECFLYQCDEGDVPESELYVQVAKVALWFADRLGYVAGKGFKDKRNESAYERAEWC